MLGTRSLLISLTILYFIIPPAVSDLVFNNEFYIYSSSQKKTNLLSFLYGLIFSFWIHFTFKRDRSSFFYKKSILFSKSSIVRLAYLSMVLYSIMLIFHGLQLRWSGALREDLLAGIDNFLVPGMSLLVLFSSIFLVGSASRIQFYSVIVIFFIIDIIYNGKIFSFLALVLFFIRLDLRCPTTSDIVRAFSYWTIIGIALLLVSGAARVGLAGEDLSVNIAGIAYLLGSEFLGVQASIGWAVEYYQQGYSLALTNFVKVLQDYYINSVGHGLAVSPGAYFHANFGHAGIIFSVVFCLISLFLIRLSAKKLDWLAYLIVAINFQHFLRHGVDVFLIKILTQIFFAYIFLLLLRSRYLFVRNTAPQLDLKIK